jgi:hypothetical protein
MINKYIICKICGNLLEDNIIESDIIEIKNTEMVLYLHDKKCKKKDCDKKNYYIIQVYNSKYSLKVLVLEKDLKFKIESNIFYLNKELNFGYVVLKIGKTGTRFKVYTKHHIFSDLFIFKTELFIKLKDSDFINGEDIKFK